LPGISCKLYILAQLSYDILTRGEHLLIDYADEDLVSIVVEKSIMYEKGRRLPIHSIHKWWSRRFAIIYRFLLTTYLLESVDEVISCIDEPWRLRKKALGKVFYEPFAGGGTGLVEAAMAGWEVYGSDINPIATEITDTALRIICGDLSEEYFLQIRKILDTALESLRECWYLYDGIVSYTLISKGKIPTWITNITYNNQKYRVVLCPSCKNIFLQRDNERRIYCKMCGEPVTVSIKPTIPLQENLPTIAPGWKAFIIEYRIKEDNARKRWRKRLVNLFVDKEGRNLLTKSIREAYSILKEYEEHLRMLRQIVLDGLYEGHRLRKEGGFKNLIELFTSRQLVSSLLFSELCSKKLNRKYWKFAKVALSDSAKTVNLLAKWYPITGEPIPATAMKTYWVPTYAVETNPLAHIPGALIPLARNTIASAIRVQKRAYQYVKNHGGIYKVIWHLYNISSERVSLPKGIDLVVIDPPYVNELKWSYTSMSLVHYAQFILFNSMIGQERLPLPQEIEPQEITYNRERYFNVLDKVLRKVSKKLNPNGRVVFMFNTSMQELWIKILDIIRKAKFRIVAIYWTLGETPGRLARSKLRGLFLIILAKNSASYDIDDKIHVVFEKPLMKASKYLKISYDTERKAYQYLLRAFSKVNNIQ